LAESKSASSTTEHRLSAIPILSNYDTNSYFNHLILQIINPNMEFATLKTAL